MKAVFAHTAFFVAFAGPEDAYHARAVKLSDRPLGRIITTEYVLVETGSMLSRPEDRPTYVNLVRDLESDPGVQIIPASSALFRAGFTLFADTPDKQWSPVDCISFVVMKQHRLKQALTTDRHFVQAGFRALLREDSRLD
jgi:predicted nucleic acid-binding protein